MNFRSHIPKPQLPKKLFLLAIGLFTALPILFTTPLTTYADDYASQVATAVYNGMSSNNRGGNSAIVNGVSYTRTGYLCYLLTKDGSITGDPAYAFASPGFSAISGSKWVCTSRRGQSVSSWRGSAPWSVTPWAEGGSPSNEPKIKEWALQTSSTGMLNAKQFVKDIWGLAAAKNFESDEYILVIETIMNFQYSVAGGSGGGGGLDPATIQSISDKCVAEAKKLANNTMRDATKEERDLWINTIASAAATQVIAKLAQEGGGTGRTFTSDPLIGTVPNLIQYKNGSKVFDSYTNKVAPHAEKIRVSEAGFTAYPSSGPNQLTDSEVQSYGVAMLIIHCKNDAIHTYNGVDSPGPPEPRLPGKTGTCNIVKGYYKENLTTGAKESLGVYSELDVTSNIIVSSEPDFELVEYLCL